jgi:hypothetical protein
VSSFQDKVQEKYRLNIDGSVIRLTLDNSVSLAFPVAPIDGEDPEGTFFAYGLG